MYLKHCMMATRVLMGALAFGEYNPENENNVFLNVFKLTSRIVYAADGAQRRGLDSCAGC